MKTYAFGADVGGTTVKIGLFTTDGTLLEKWEIPTRTENNGEEIMPDIMESINSKMAERGLTNDDVQGIGLDVPGPVTREGIVQRCVNLNWGIINVVAEMAKLTDLPVKVVNDRRRRRHHRQRQDRERISRIGRRDRPHDGLPG